MTRILELVKTYTPRGDGMAHDGYFVVTNNYPLKWVEAWRWEDMSSRSQFRTRLDHLIQSLTDASKVNETSA